MLEKLQVDNQNEQAMIKIFKKSNMRLEYTKKAF